MVLLLKADIHADYLCNCISVNRLHVLLIHTSTTITIHREKLRAKIILFGETSPLPLLQLKGSYCSPFAYHSPLSLMFSKCSIITSIITTLFSSTTFHLRELHTLLLLEDIHCSCTETLKLFPATVDALSVVILHHFSISIWNCLDLSRALSQALLILVNPSTFSRFCLL